ncbi:hypothetical protein M406DRAFT_65990 [Cryphonectria parasitica EP155]|uniref:Uncharacterized protein n=1 Tax=Cryphonectria parasitica (strain ATCC 38755 / EP155) TaxID=660469 RepID=A0A9P4YAM3_CRYP1|nr:uncharacterized protein M406DRAFT_65990 [Cryphonectria parasitica EP155]KAF3769499.1 hypothetical protein M406DRAFT_65990 [Cryphonectria parasitica EP155]
MSSRRVDFEIVVQPPQTVTICSSIEPPVVARTRDRRLLEAASNQGNHVFAVAVLYASNMDPGDGTNISWSASAAPYTENTSSSGSSSSSGRRRWLYFIFSGMTINTLGVFSLQIVVHVLRYSHNEWDQADQVVSANTRHFTVLTQASSADRPSSSERRILRQLEAAQLYIRDAY